TSTDSTPIFSTRYCPSTTSPSFAGIGGPLLSLSTAILLCSDPMTPMNFSGIGGSGGGGGGPVTTGALTGGAIEGGGPGGGGGGAFGLYRNRLRSGPAGFGFSASSASRCTSGAPPCAGVACSARPVPRVATACRLDDGGAVADVAGSSR